MVLLCGWISVSKVLRIEDAVALPKDLVSLFAEVELLTKIAHIEQLLVVLLQKTE